MWQLLEATFNPKNKTGAKKKKKGKKELSIEYIQWFIAHMFMELTDRPNTNAGLVLTSTVYRPLCAHWDVSM